MTDLKRLNLPVCPGLSLFGSGERRDGMCLDEEVWSRSDCRSGCFEKSQKDHQLIT